MGDARHLLFRTSASCSGLHSNRSMLRWGHGTPRQVPDGDAEHAEIMTFKKRYWIAMGG